LKIGSKDSTTEFIEDSQKDTEELKCDNLFYMITKSHKGFTKGHKGLK